jgi:RNA polymerase sigma factor (sigma-70 family)
VTPERARLEAAYAAHGRAVLAYAMRRTDPHTASDVLSEVFLTAWRRIDHLPAEPLPWLLGTARRVLANQRRADGRRVALEDRLIVEYSSGAARMDDVDGGGDGRADGAVLEALARLAEPDREALMLVGWDGLAPREAAAALGIRASTFTMRLSRARKRLAAALAEIDAAAASEPRVPEVQRVR